MPPVATLQSCLGKVIQGVAVAENPIRPCETSRYHWFVVTPICRLAAAGVVESGRVQFTIMMRTERTPVSVAPGVV